MRKIFLCAVTLLAALSYDVAAQNPTTYFMEGSTFRTQWNPAFAPQRGYINIPILGGLELGTNGNVALDNLLYSKGNTLTTIFSSSIPATVALSELEATNYFGGTATFNLVGFGAFTTNQKNFWSFNINLRSNINATLPYSFFDFMKTGKAQDISGIGLKADSYIEAAFTYSFPIGKKVYLGVSGKLLVGATRANLYFERFDAQLNADNWTAEAVGVMEISGLTGEYTTDADGRKYYDDFDSFDNVKMPAGYGFSFDVGATYNPLPELQISASVNDIGAMFWSKKQSVAGKSNEKITFDGVQIDASGHATQPEFDLDKIKFEVADNKGITEMLPTSFNIGAEYNFLDHRIGLGVFYNALLSEYKTQHNITASANFRPLKWLHASGSYSLLGNDAHALGLALNICPWGGINLFVGTDILLSKKTPQWIPISQSNMNVTFGLGIPVGRRSTRFE